ncbi:TIGR03086 family metal-binding protein [Nonomuraea sp. NPDC003804]|uniref:TIGR03086 family metal-binding protein n=1 Tax=Nonomuraea sp. NPDC003804 TaxID=3154547 RepID=UPI0033AC8ABD
MDEMINHLTSAARPTAALVRDLREEELPLPTPCAEYDVRGLLTHMEWVAETFETMAARQPRPEQGEYAGDFPDRIERTLTAWSKPQAWEGETPFGMPMAAAAHLLLIDLVVHGWDLARATGRPYAQDAGAVEEALGFAEQMAPMGRAQGAFADEVVVRADAPALDRLLGLTGRDPGWTAPITD